MYKMKRLKSALALFLAAAMALTGPVQSAGFVRAEEAVTEETQDAEQTASEEAQDAEQTASEEAQDAEQTASEEAQDAAKTSAPETEAVGESGDAAPTEEAWTDTGIVQETAEETTEAETTSGETPAEAEELKLSETDIRNAVALSIGRNENIIIKEGEESKWYYIEPKEDEAYIVKLIDGSYAELKMSGAEKSFRNSYNYSDTQKMFIGKAGERVYFQPRFPSPDYEEDDYYDEDRLTVTAVIDVQMSEKGTVTKDDDGKYILSYNNTNISLAVSAFNTTISCQAEEQDKTDEEGYNLYAYCSGEAYGRDGVGYISYSSGECSFYGLDMNGSYHIDYVLYSRDGVFACFSGTGEPFDITTKNTDKVGGEITDITADFAEITVNYELFGVDIFSQDNAWIRYKKDGEDEWNYDELWLEGEGDIGSHSIRWVDSDTRYTVELVSRDKKTVYDSRQVTTEKYEGKVTVTVNSNETKPQSVQIDITGYDVNISDGNIRALKVYLQYTDSSGVIRNTYDSFHINSAAFESGTVSFTVNGLEAGTEYKDAKILAGWNKTINYRTQYQWIYSGKVSFTTKESFIKEENIGADITPAGQNTADITVEVKEIPSGESFRLEYTYRRKGVTPSWKNWYTAGYLASDNNVVTFRLDNLDETDYEIEFRIDGTTKVWECHFTPAAVEGDVKVTVKVAKKFVNALELEAALTGAEADNMDTYTCRFEVFNDSAYGDGRWKSVWTITLDPAKPVTQQLQDWYEINSGEKQRWRYRVYRNGSEYDMGYLDVSETQTIPLELDITSIEIKQQRFLDITCNVKNWSDVLFDEEDCAGRTSIDTGIRLRRKGEEKWEDIDAGRLDFRFDRNGSGRSGIWLYDSEGAYMIPEPGAQYELRLVSCGDGSVVYAEKTFTVAGSWEISEENNFVYSSTDTRRSITISGNYGKPEVEVENDNIVSVKEIRKSRIYLDIHNVGMTKLAVTADGITKNVTVAVSPSAQELFYLEGADEGLKDIKLPDNFKWVNPSDTPKADDENKIQCFDVTIEESDGTKYGKVPVAVSTLEEDGITIQGRETIGSGKEGIYSVFYEGRGFDVAYYGEGKAYEISQEWTGDDGLVIKSGGKDRNVTVTGGTAGEHELTLTVKVKNLQTGKTLERKKTQKIKVIGAGFIDNLIIKPAKEQPVDTLPYMATGSVVSGQVIEINCEGYDLSKNNKLQLEAKTDRGTRNEAGEPVLDDASVKWSSENEDIFVIDEKGLVTVKNKGEGVFKATAEDEGGYTEPVRFKIYDNSPVFESTEITVRDGSLEGTRLSYREKDDNRVTGMTLTGSDRLEAVQHTGGDSGWYVRTRAGYTEETTETVTLKITTENKKTYDQQLKVTVIPEPRVTPDADAGAGTLAFSQTAIPNLFYVNSEAVFDVTDTYEGYEIEDIRTVEKDKDAQNFHVKSYNAAQKTITFTANRLDTTSVAAYAAKNSSNAVANVEVKFKDHDGYYPKDGNGIPIRVSVQNKPVSALKAEDAFVTGSINTAQVDVLDKKTVFDLSGSSFEIVSAKTKAENLTASAENGSLRLTQTGENAKGGKYTFNVTNPNWTKVLTLTGKLSRVDVSKLTMKASKTKATLNTKYNDSVKISVSVKGNADLPVVLATEVKPATDALAVEVSGDNRSITLGVAEGKSLASGKYTISVTGKIGEEKTKETKITLTVTDKEPEVKLSAKGSINILNRDLSGITYTATIKNTDAEIKSAELTGDSMLTFNVVKNDGKRLTLKALKDAENIDTKKPYEVKLKLTLSNGAVIKDVKGVTLKVKPVDKLPKIKLDAPKKPAISKTAKNSVAVKLDMEAGYRIDRIELDGNDKDKFDVKMNGQSAFTISLAENAGSIDAKSYSLKYKLYFAGANAATKQVTKSIKITVSE